MIQAWKNKRMANQKEILYKKFLAFEISLSDFSAAKLLPYRIAGYLPRVQLSRMPSFYHEPVIFSDVLFETWRFFDNR